MRNQNRRANRNPRRGQSPQRNSNRPGGNRRRARARNPGNNRHREPGRAVRNRRNPERRPPRQQTPRNRTNPGPQRRAPNNDDRAPRPAAHAARNPGNPAVDEGLPNDGGAYFDDDQRYTPDVRLPADSHAPQFDLDSIPYDWARDELTLERDCQPGDSGEPVWRIQEWLSLQGFGTTLDGEFGSATRDAVAAFQQDSGLEPSGVVDAETFAALVSPMTRALQRIDDALSPGQLAVRYAEQHLAEHPREVGGQNRGPWVRLYMEGNDGEDFAWCAGFASFVHRQAADTLSVNMSFDPSFSCDLLAQNGSANGAFVTDSEIASGAIDPIRLPIGSLFLNRRTADDWNHTGIVVHFDTDSFETIEGNTNDEGSREGYEVCRRVRSYDSRDFVLAD